RATILRLFHAVARLHHEFALALAGGRDRALRHALTYQVGRRGVGAAFGELLVVGVAPDRVGVADDADRRRTRRLRSSSRFAQHCISFSRDVALVEAEEDDELLRHRRRRRRWRRWRRWRR